MSAIKAAGVVGFVAGTIGATASQALHGWRELGVLAFWAVVAAVVIWALAAADSQVG